MMFPWSLQPGVHAPVACALAANAFAIARVPVLHWEHPQKKTAFTAKAFVDVQVWEGSIYKSSFSCL